jgi:hypothetical protein
MSLFSLKPLEILRDRAGESTAHMTRGLLRSIREHFQMMPYSVVYEFFGMGGQKQGLVFFGDWAVV